MLAFGHDARAAGSLPSSSQHDLVHFLDRHRPRVDDEIGFGPARPFSRSFVVAHNGFLAPFVTAGYGLPLIASYIFSADTFLGSNRCKTGRLSALSLSTPLRPPILIDALFI
jgi:hypothetical protein